MNREMPLELVMVRHGFSESNYVQKMGKTTHGFTPPDSFFERHDVHARLTPLGVEQASLTGDWLNEEFPDGLYRYYVSPLIRTLETAGSLGLRNAKWRFDDRWRERDWGEYAALSDEEAKEKYAASRALRKLHKWYWCPPGGESLATGVRSRAEALIDHMCRETAGQSNIAVTHGETMEVFSMLLERLTPDEWLARNRDPNYDMGNCQVLQYTRKNPETGQTVSDLRWRRSLNIADSTKNWDNGQWVELQPRKLYTNGELIVLAEQIGRLFPQ